MRMSSQLNDLMNALKGMSILLHTTSGSVYEGTLARGDELAWTLETTNGQTFVLALDDVEAIQFASNTPVT